MGVIGDPVRHSLSPLLHNAAFDAMGLDWVSVGFEVRAGDLPSALVSMRALGIVGLSVTTPHKDAAAASVDERSALAQRLGAVNCVVQRDGRLFGDSTDGEGFVQALRRGPNFDPAGMSCLVLGAGGAARAVVLALAQAGAAEVTVVNRTPERGASAAALAGDKGHVGDQRDVSGADLVVQATSLGMAGAPTPESARNMRGDVPSAGSPRGSDTLMLDPDLFRSGQLVADLVYHPPLTPLLRAASERGARTMGGLGMLVHQAALAIERWTGEPAPVEEMWAAARAATEEGLGER